MQTDRVKEEQRSTGFAGTRLEFIRAPFLERAFRDFIVLSAEIPEEGWLDREPVARLLFALYLLRRDFGDDLWDKSPDDTLPNLSEDEIDRLWDAMRRVRGRARIGGFHPWTYLRDAWCEVAGQRLPGRRNPRSIELTGDPPHAYYFKLAVACCISRLDPTI